MSALSPSVPRGRFVWYELMTSDPKAAQSFYPKLSGWKSQPWDGGPRPYTMWMNGDKPVGGVMTLPDEAKQQGAPPHWLAYIATPNVDDTVRDVSNRGGRVLHGPADVPTVGRIAILADPQGAAFAAHTAEGNAPGHDGPWQVGEFSWHELATTDPSAACDFYSGVFGWVKTDAMDMGPGGTYQMFGRSKDRSMGGIFKKPAEMPGPSAWLQYVRVDSVDTRVTTVQELGGQILNGPMDVPGGDRVAQCLDPQGAAFAIHSSAA